MFRGAFVYVTVALLLCAATGDEDVSKNNFNRNIDKSLFVDEPLNYCKTPAKCQQLPKNHTVCMGSKLPYSSTTFELAGLAGLDKVQEQLNAFNYLKYVPKCWAVIQPFLCALYMPRCETAKVDLPSREMCKITLGPCRLFLNSTIFANFADCNFPSRCKNDVHELKFNTTGFCLEPLVKTDHSDWFYPG